ncbi:hypothetical protein CLV85_0673 [Salinibacterium amurskyense]|uniref:Uncharacterized protein n=1 Tax=Salinibacterium amurskyense TaxID=205941 RepID=A0A2M9D715_9MICO|nr:hypothetical protein CLV85_0673 [Salinibacterium amurskyense]RLQ83483.1 hypothetical protein D9C83_03320 [Salinibacterium amurskyense]GHD80294.1 hypothetical protein GCM10007394_11400 [Salinibacterium amurskyense]
MPLFVERDGELKSYELQSLHKSMEEIVRPVPGAVEGREIGITADHAAGLGSGSGLSPFRNEAIPALERAVDEIVNRVTIHKPSPPKDDHLTY